MRNALLLSLLIALSACSGGADEVTRTLAVSAERLDEIRAAPHPPGHPGLAARLTGIGDDEWPTGVMFLDAGPYLGELGLVGRRVIVLEIDGVDARTLFLDRWNAMRLQDAGAFDVMHYRDFVATLFSDERGDEVILTVRTGLPATPGGLASQAAVTERWRIELGR